MFLTRLLPALLLCTGALVAQPVTTVTRLVGKFGFTAPTANTALVVLVEQGIVREITGHRRNRVFSYTEYLRTLNEGTE